MGAAYTEDNRAVHRLCCSLLAIANQWEDEELSVKSGVCCRDLAEVLQGTSMDRHGWAGKVLADVPPKQQLFTHEGVCPGEVEVVRAVSSKSVRFSVPCQVYYAVNVSCLKSGAKEEEASVVTAEHEVMFMAAVQGNGKSSFTAPATSWDCHSHLLQSTGLLMAHSACSCLFKKNGDGLTRYREALYWIRSRLSSEWKYKVGRNSYEVYLRSWEK